MQEFEKNKKALNPLPDSRSALDLYVKQCEADTCRWIIDLDQYKTWRKSPNSSFLYVKGEAGESPSVILEPG